MSVTRAYVGKELPLFFGATNFHRYHIKLFGDWVRGNVLEVGAGLGALTQRLLECGPERVAACEPDPELAAGLVDRLGKRADVVIGGVRDVPMRMGPFDAIVYIDVLEHIEDDRSEVDAAVARLKPGGALIIGGPAHPWLYSSFDAAIGHCRRYNRRMIDALIGSCASLEIVRFVYFDCLGAVLSLGNRWLRGQSIPSRRQVTFWDSLVLPISRRLDPLLRYRVGKSFVTVARLRSRDQHE